MIHSNLSPSKSPVSVKDSTGAGDMYAAGFISSLCRGLEPIEAAKIGSFIAEEIIQQTGAQFNLNKIKELRFITFLNSTLYA